MGDEWYKITAIGEGAFRGCTNYTEIKLPATLNTINESAFEGCTQLTEIDIPEGVGYIYANAFKDCTALVTVNIPSSLYSIGEGAFMGCAKLKNITLGYTFPEKWMKKIHISNLRLFLTVDNVFTLTEYPGIDPEFTDNMNYYSNLRQYTAGITLKF